MANILIIDDDRGLCQVLSKAVKKLGHTATSTFNLEEGLGKVVEEAYDVVFLDVMLPDGNGLDVLPRLVESSSSPEVIIITGTGDRNGAELAIKSGAWDYIEKPSSLQSMTLPLVRALQYRSAKKQRTSSISLKRDGIVGSSARMRACLDLVAQAAGAETNALVTGETGTGKELFASAIHTNSRRLHNNFVVVDCAALHETLVQSILFGYEKGAYTGASVPHDGLIKQADGGTLFLDEVGELSSPLQKVFLRILQDRSFRPLGAKREIQSDFRLIAATNRNLEEMVAAGDFRSDLLYRLASLVIELPPLREHSEDIKELTIYHTTRLCNNRRMEIKGFSQEFFEALERYDWPGNIRELVNVLDRAITLAGEEPILFPKHLPTAVRIKAKQFSTEARPAPDFVSTNERPGLPKLREFRETVLTDAEQKYMNDLMRMTNGNIEEACQVSGLSRPRLYALLSKYGLTRSRPNVF